MNKINDNVSKLGESPIWNHFDNSFYWVDILDRKIKSWNDYKFQVINLEQKPTSVGLIDSTKIFLTVSDGLGIFDIRDNEYHSLLNNDVKSKYIIN